MPKLRLKRTPDEQLAHDLRKRRRKHADTDDSDDFHQRFSLAFEDDDRLDALEARFNEYAHVPHRWGGPSRPTNKYEGEDPNLMEEEEYVEWMRAGMYRSVQCRSIWCRH